MSNHLTESILNSNVIEKFSKIKISLFFLPLLLLSTILLFLYSHNALSTYKYIEIQKNCFYFINSKLAQFPTIIYNLNHIGDTLIFLSFLSIFIVYAPKVWESLLSATIVAAIFSKLLKAFFSVPRPAAALDNDTFVIIGEKLVGFNSLPSGHSITVFTTISIVMFAFMPNKITNKILWSSIIVVFGLFIAFIRVGVGAHFPLDVVIGCIIGYISALIGILISVKYKIWSWINNKKYYPIFILLFIVFCILLIVKIVEENLIIYYLSIISLIVSLYKIAHAYIKK